MEFERSIAMPEVYATQLGYYWGRVKQSPIPRDNHLPSWRKIQIDQWLWTCEQMLTAHREFYRSTMCTFEEPKRELRTDI